MGKEWFASWFDSPYYPLLYSHRNEAEAEGFIARLIGELNPAPGSKSLDLACGRGRHSISLHGHGLDVTGLDLSPASIADAALHEQEGLRFKVGDMRKPLPGGPYQYVFNLFTSFGYFSDLSHNLRVLQQIHAVLNPGGTLVIDFLNANRVIRNLVPAEEKDLNGVHFGIRREVRDGIILKHIHVEDGEKTFDFTEQVQALRLKDFQTMSATAGFQILKTWGDYEGNAYEPETSPRLILFFQS